MKAGELRQLSVEELGAKARELRGEYFNARIKHVTGQLENSARLRTLRREVARAETVLTEKKREAGQ